MSAAEEIFQRLKGLVGAWEGVTDAGRPLHVEYRLAASATVLVETWTTPSGSDALTLYHLDGQALVAAHYCPLGNQPRLRLRTEEADGSLTFEFDSATNLAGPDAPHQRAFQLGLVDQATFWRSETYVEAGEATLERAEFRRAGRTTP